MTTEEATKQSLVLPFLQALGYNVFDPTEVRPEFTADIGTKQGEKVDYAIMLDDSPVILVECKKAQDNLTSADRVSQLYRYFGTTTKARIGVLTNGIRYHFFSDLESDNVMDTTPFLQVDLENLEDGVLEQLGQLAKGFNVDETVEAASRLRYIGGMKQALAQQLNYPEDDFMDWIVRRVYPGRMTQAVRERFSHLVRQAFQEFVNDRITATLRTAQNLAQIPDEETTQRKQDLEEGNEDKVQADPKVVTTVQEWEAYAIVKALVREVVNPERVFIRDYQQYCAVVMDDSRRKPLCRLRLDSSQKQIGLFDGTREGGNLVEHRHVEHRHNIESLDDIYQFADQLSEMAKQYLDT